MSKLQISPLQMVDATHWKGITHKNQIGALWKQAPQKISDQILAIQSYNFGNNLDTFLSQYEVKTLEDENDFIWELRGNAPKNVTLISASFNGVPITATTSAEVGKNGTIVELTFEKDLFNEGDVIAGENPDSFQLRIEKYYASGMYFVAECTLWQNDDTLSIPVEDLLPNTLWSNEMHPVESTLSRDGGEVSYTSNISLRNAFTHIRMKQICPGNMVGKELAGCFVKDKKDPSKMIKLWTDYQTYMFDYEFRMMWNRAIMFGRSNKSAQGTYRQAGKSGFEIKAGAGFRQQMETSNTTFYIDFTIKKLNANLADLSEGKLELSNRKFMARTGERGSIQFHESLENYSSLYSPSRETKRIYSKATQLNATGLGYGGQFVEYRAPNGVEFNLSIDSMYDNRDRNKKFHPTGNGVQESYRYDILDIGTTKGEPNIQMYKASNLGEVYGFIQGLRSPFNWLGKGKGYGMGSMASDVDGWVEHKFKGGAIAIKDPTKTASMIYGQAAV